MDWQTRLGAALDYLERHLKDDIDLGAAAGERSPWPDGPLEVYNEPR